MPDYRENEAAGTVRTFHRFPRIIIDNPYQGFPTITVVEQEIVKVDGRVVSSLDVNTLTFPFDPERVYQMVDAEGVPVAGQSMTDALLYCAVYAAVLSRIYERDAAAQQPET